MTSVGDVLALIDLAHNLATLLKDSIDAPTEFREFILELNFMSSALDGFHQLLSGPKPLQLQPSTCNEVDLAICRSKILIRDFMGRFKGYHDSFKQGGSGNLVRDFGRKVFWAYHMSKKVIDLRKKLLEQQVVINLILSFSNHATLDRVEHIAQENRTTLAAMHHIMQQPSQTLEQYLLLWLVDIRGTLTPFPMGFCTDWDTFDEALKLYFKGKVGQKYVNRGDYDLTAHGDTQAITPATWSSRIKAGVTVDMNAILRLQGSDILRCPSCRGSTSDVVQSGGEMTCPSCQTLFRVSDSFVEEVGLDEGTESNHGVRYSPPADSSQKNTNMEDEACFLRRFHVILITVVQSGYSPREDGDEDDDPDLESSFVEDDALPKKKALLIGINYAADHDVGKDVQGGPLGSHKDVLAVKQLLVDKYGYKNDDIVDMMDDRVGGGLQPTHANITRELDGFITDPQPGDRYYFHYAGHTSQRSCENSTEEDGVDEAIVPCDSDPSTYDKVIFDDDLRRYLVDRLPPGSNLVAVFDTCRSRTLLDLPHHRRNRVDLNA